MADDSGPVTSPSQVDATQQSAPQPQQSADPTTDLGLVPNDISGAQAPVVQTNPAVNSLSASYKGVTPHGAAVAGGAFGRAAQQTADFAQQDSQQALAEREQARMDSMALQHATQGEVGATRDYIDRDRGLEDKLVKANEAFANVEKQANAEAQASRAQYMSDYQTQLAGVRHLMQQSGNPLDTMSRGQMFGMAFAQFAQGFLAARGIKIDVSGQIDNWVNRSIQEHQMQIANARESAADSLHMYEIARQTSQDDWEARQRYRGFVIAGLQTQIQANASAFQSQIALAHAQESVAKLQIDADATMRSISDRHFTRLKDEQQLNIDAAYKQMMASIEQQKVEIERQKAALAGKTNQKPLVPITDPEATIGPDGKETHRIIGFVDPANTEGLKDIQQKRYATQKIYKAADDLQAAYERAGLNEAVPKSKWAATTGSAEYRQYQAARTALINQLVYLNSGKQINENEFKRYEELVPDETFWQKGNNRWSLPQLRNAAAEDMESARDTYDVRAGTGSLEDVSPRTRADYKAMMAGQKPVETQISADTKAATGDSREAHGEASKLFEKFAEDQRNDGKDAGEKYTGEGSRMKMLQPDSTVGVEHFVRAVVDPASMRKLSDSKIVGPVVGDDKKLSADARERLEDLASGKLKASEQVRELAKYSLKLIDEDPEAVKKLLERAQ